MFSEVVCLSTGAEVSVSVQGVSVWGVSVQGGLCSRGVSVRERSLSGGLSRGVSVQGGPCLGGSLSGRPPYSSKRTVHILLECILVLHAFLFSLLCACIVLKCQALCVMLSTER